MIKSIQYSLFSIVILSFTLLAAIPAYAATTLPSDTIISGSIVNQNGQPMSAVVVEIEKTHIYTLSDINGKFHLNIKDQRLPVTLTFKFIGYFTRRIEITSRGCAEQPMEITMLPGSDEDARKLSTTHKMKYSAFAWNLLTYSYINANFDNFTELSPAQKSQLNTNSHFFGFGLEANISNIYAHLNFAFAPLSVSYTNDYSLTTSGNIMYPTTPSNGIFQTSNTYRMLTDAYAISFNVGYTFPFFKHQYLLLTPYIGINHVSYNEYVAPLKKHIPLDQFLSMGYLDYSVLQYTSTIGVKAAVKLAQFGRNKRQSIYLTASVAYNYQINRHPYIFSRSTHIHTKSSINVYPIAAQTSIIYSIGKKMH